jgi:hypothetical protein
MKTENLTLLEAAKAVLEGKRVENRCHGGPWIHWDGLEWHDNWVFRIAPEPKKMRKVKMLGYKTPFGLLKQIEQHSDDHEEAVNKLWLRAPSKDEEIEVEDV